MENFKLVHRVFKITTLIKGIYSFLETLIGFLLLFISTNSLFTFFQNLFGTELIEDPHDVLANFFVNNAGTLTNSLKEFIALYLIIHGLIKVGLIAALWLEKPKAYPVAGIVFTLFIAYQIYKYVSSPSWILIFLTVLDLVVIVLIYFEYKHLNYWIKLKQKGRDKFFG